MEYISASEAAGKWGVSERRVQKLCVDGRIPGVTKFGRMWMIPREAKKPMDKRYKPVPSKLSVEDIVKQYGSYIYVMAYKLSGKPDLAQDIAQETFVKAWKNLEQLKNPGALKQWLHTICVNEYKMMVRKDLHDNVVYTDNIEELEQDGQALISCPEAVIEEMQATEEVIQLRNGCFTAMAQKLSVNQRIVFSLIDMFGLTVKQVAVILGITPKAVKGLLYRARMNLDSFFHNHCSFLDIENTCHCTAWIQFFQKRDASQITLQEKILDYKQKEYSFDLETRQKIAYYYQQIPDHIPPDNWYEQIICLITGTFT